MIFREQRTWQICFTSCAPVLLCLFSCMHAVPWHSPSANTQGINEHKARSSNWSNLRDVVSCQPDSLSLHVRESQSGKAKHAALRLIQPQPLTLKVEPRIKDLIIVSTLKWDKEWNFFWERLPLSKKKSVTHLSSWQETHSPVLKCYMLMAAN